MSAATIPKGVPIGRLSQRHGLENCVLAMQKVHGLETHERWRAAEATNTATLGARMSCLVQNVPVVAEVVRVYASLLEVCR